MGRSVKFPQLVLENRQVGYIVANLRPRNESLKFTLSNVVLCPVLVSEKREVVMCNREESLKCVSPNLKFSCLVLEKREVVTCNNQPQPVIKCHVMFLGLVLQRRDVVKCNG